MRASGSSRMLTLSRCGVGNGSGGGENEGWNPPTLTTKSASSPQAMSSPSSPFSVMKRRRDSYRLAKNQIRCRSAS